MRAALFIQIILILSAGAVKAQTDSPIDSKATQETVALFRNMKELSKNHTLFAHQHATGNHQTDNKTAVSTSAKGQE